MSELTKRTFKTKGSRDRDILIDVTLREDFVPKPIVVFAHGYKGYKDWGAWNLVAEQFANAGYVFVKFNFSHNGGTTDNPIDFPDLDAFGKNTYTTELEDLNLVIDWVKQHDWSGHGAPDRLGLIGHSRGGGITILSANEKSEVKAIATWASVRDFEERFPSGEELEKWKKEGIRYINNARTGQEMPHQIEFYDDFVRNSDRLNIQAAMEKLDIPLFIIHGREDEAVPLTSAESLFKWSSTALMEIVDDAGHTFGSKQPWDQPDLPKHLKIITEDTISFFKDVL